VGRARFVDAQAACKELGGFLVTYPSLSKQVEIEGVFTARGLLNKNLQVRATPTWVTNMILLYWAAR
jgi:hypothetical protein